MKISFKHTPRLRKKPQTGISLIIVMLMVVIIGITSAAAIRNATTGERSTNNIRMQGLAQQYAEAALRYCEEQVLKPDATRAVLKESTITLETAFGADPGWNKSTTWIAGAGVAGDAHASLISLSASQIKSGDSSLAPTILPQCVAERQVLANGTKVYVITARGFSPDYTFTASTGATKSGSVVWLQSTLL